MKEIKNFAAAKTIYDSMKIPAELNIRLEKEILLRKEFQEEDKAAVREPRIYTVLKFGLATAAACTAIFMTALNTSPVFAQSAGNLPVVGPIAKILTLRSYEQKDEDKAVKVTLPQVVSDASTAQKVNKMIEDKSKTYLEEAQKRVQEYKDAFLSTGGTEKEFQEKNIEIKVDYEIKYQDDDMVSFVLFGGESWVSAYDFNTYFNINLKDDMEITLEDLLGKNYIETANQRIEQQMKERVKENPDNMYFTPEEGGFETIGENTRFYINEKKNPVIVFDKYEIAPGSMGIQEFEIPRE